MVMLENLLPFGEPLVSFRPRKETKRIIVHESHTGPEVTRAVHYLRAKGRANGLLEIGYHVVIDRDGNTTITRPLHVIGSHAPGCNHDSIGICMAADKAWDYRAQWTQVDAFRLMVHRLRDAYGPLQVVGHDEALRRAKQDHKCPSFNMEEMRSIITDNREAPT
jgi:hypothetical protein